ncbi:MAG: ABC transporter ATP-binding protein [Actinobacteria bacterium]|nr:ABC transporter ATP-binding protein [Actinomycetota bacterium]
MEQERNINEKYVIECNGISKIFYSGIDEFKVIDKIDLKVRENEFLVLFGPGQCGKTILLNIIAGLELPTDGMVLVNGKKIESPGPDRGVVYQTTALFPWLTTMGNVEYGLKVRGINKNERRKRAQYYINLVGLQGFEKVYPNKLSGGMKQRVGIARAYCIEPVVMLMDEPFGSLDAQTRYLMQKELGFIYEKERRTVIFITNNIEEALYLADRVVVLNNCPTSIKTEYIIDMPRPRDYIDPKFLRLRKEISSIKDRTL